MLHAEIEGIAQTTAIRSLKGSGCTLAMVEKGGILQAPEGLNDRSKACSRTIPVGHKPRYIGSEIVNFEKWTNKSKEEQQFHKIICQATIERTTRGSIADRNGLWDS